MYKPQTLAFIKDLVKNNNKSWFDAHKKAYETAREDHLQFTAKLIAAVGSWDDDIKKLQPKDCVYRIYRDVRFSKDKTPYKNHFGAYLSPGGKKSMRAGYYFHMQPGNAFLGGGMWEPAPATLKAIRQEIDYNLQDFEAILNDKDFRKFYAALGGSKLQKAPKDYAADAPGINYLKHKDFIVTCPLPDTLLVSEELLPFCTEAFKALQPLNQFLDTALE